MVADQYARRSPPFWQPSHSWCGDRHGRAAGGVRDPLAEAKVTRLTDFAGTEQAAAISRDGRFVAFLANRDGRMDAWLTEIGSNRYRNLTEGQIRDMTNASVRTVSFSPDGALVTLWTRSADGSRPEDIKVMGAPTAGGPLQVYLPEVAEYDWSAGWKATGLSTRPAPGDPLFVRAATETTAHQIYVAPPGIHCHFPIWSTDGEFIYFLRGEPPVHWDVWRLRPSGEGLEQITFHNTKLSYPVVLDPRTLIYLATDADGSGPWLYVMDLQPEKRAPHQLRSRTLPLAGCERGRHAVGRDRRQFPLGPVERAHRRQWIARQYCRADDAGAAECGGTALRPWIHRLYVDRRRPPRDLEAREWRTNRAMATTAEADRVGAPAIAPDGRRIAFSRRQAWNDATVCYRQRRRKCAADIKPLLRCAVIWLGRPIRNRSSARSYKTANRVFPEFFWMAPSLNR